MNIACIIQARMGSTRLPGKILKKVMDKTLLEYQIERLRQSALINNIIVATTTKKHDDLIEQFCKNIGIDYYRGSEYNVLERYYETANQFNADVIIRVTSDCPLIDPNILDDVIVYFMNNDLDYVSNIVKRTHPRGLDVEVLSMKCLEIVHSESTTETEKEHVTYHILSNQDKFKIGYINQDDDQSHHRWTVDTEEDFLLIKNILEYLYPKNKNFRMNDVIKIFELFPDWFYINHHIEQKKV